MAKVTPQKTSFSAGEISDLLSSRPELDPYKNGVAYSLNGIPLMQGPWVRRPGTYFAAEVKDSSSATRVVEFKFSTTQAYILEFGNLYVRFYKDGGPVLLATQAITAITKSNPAVVTYSGADTYANGDDVELAGIVGMTELNGRRCRVANVDTGANTFELSGVDSTGYTTYVSGGTIAEVYTVTTPFTAAELPNLRFNQSADVLYITSNQRERRTLTRTSHTSWTLDIINPSDGPYFDQNTTATTITPSGTTGAVTLTASASLFAATDINRSVRIKNGTTWGWAYITAFTSDLLVNAQVVVDFAATTATTVWRLGLYCQTTGFPAVSTFHEGRLCYAGSTSAPQRIDLSVSGDYNNFAPSAMDGTVADDNAISATLDSDDVQVIRWIKSDERGLLVGTVEGEWLIKASDSTQALSPTNKAARQTGNAGSANMAPVRTDKSIIFTQKSGKNLRELAYVFESDGFRSPDMTVFWEHLLAPGIIEIKYQKSPQPIIWAVRADGDLLGFTYNRDQNILGWHRHTIGGWSDSLKTISAKVESIAIIPSSDGKRDEVWMVVNRYINGATKRYVEYFTKIWEPGDAQVTAVYMDSTLTYTGASTNTITGLHHLVGETLQTYADGNPSSDVTVDSTGAVTLPENATTASLGYGYYSEGQSLRFDVGSQIGSSIGKTQSITKVTFLLRDSLGLQVGPDFDNLSEVNFLIGSLAASTTLPLFSGSIKQMPWGSTPSCDERICWRFYQNSPGTLLGFIPLIDTRDE